MTRNLWWERVFCTFPLGRGDVHNESSTRWNSTQPRAFLPSFHTSCRSGSRAHPTGAGTVIDLTGQTNKKYLGSVALLQGTVTTHFQSFRLYLEISCALIPWQKWNSISTANEDLAQAFSSLRKCFWNAHRGSGEGWPQRRRKLIIITQKHQPPPAPACNTPEFATLRPLGLAKAKDYKNGILGGGSDARAKHAGRRRAPIEIRFLPHSVVVGSAVLPAVVAGPFPVCEDETLSATRLEHGPEYHAAAG